MSELSDFAVKQIQKAVEVQIITDKTGNEYSTNPIYPVTFPIEERKLPAPACFAVNTLTGLVDFIIHYNKKIDDWDPAIIHIQDHAAVSLYSEPFGPAKQRTEFVKASFTDLLGISFKFGVFYEQESFIIGLQALFVPTPTRDDVLKVIGTIKENQVRDFSDDGVSQSVAAKAGVALVSEVKVPNPVILQPFRTFREIEQPASPFVLRVRQGKEAPECALFEADGGRWKLEAIAKIKEYLEDKIVLPIFA